MILEYFYYTKVLNVPFKFLFFSAPSLLRYIDLYELKMKFAKRYSFRKTIHEHLILSDDEISFIVLRVM